MFVYKTNEKPDMIKKTVNMIESETNDFGIVIPLNDELLFNVSLNYLYDLKNKINKAIAIKKCGNY